MSYYLLILIFALLAGTLLTVMLLRHHWVSSPSDLQLIVDNLSSPSGPDPLDRDQPLSLLLYEEQYPAFTKILGTVLNRFPLSRFLENREFNAAFESVCRSAFQQTDPRSAEMAMATIVNYFLRDPDVEYECRRELNTFVPDFLSELKG